MSQPKDPPISIRLPADVLAILAAAAQPGEARNAVIVRLLRDVGPSAISKPAAIINRALKRLPAEAPPKEAVEALNQRMSSVQLGPSLVAAGSRLKKR